MPDFEVTSPSGQKFMVTAPDGATQSEILAFAQENMPKAPSAPADTPKSIPQKMAEGSAEGVKTAGILGFIPGAVAGVAGTSLKELGSNAAMGGLRGAANIGQTLLRPFDAATDKGPGLSSLVTGKIPLTNAQQRGSQINDFFQQNADPNSPAFRGGQLGAEIAGTSGVGGLLAKPVAAVAPKLAASLASGGLSLNAPAGANLAEKAVNAGTRILGGAASGAASAGLVNPDNAGTGAAIGGALPVAVKAGGALGSGLKTAGEYILGSLTGTGRDAVRNAFAAGKVGSQDFLDNMRGNVSFEDVVDAAKQGLRNMRADRAAQYRSGMVDIKADKTVLDMSPITKAVEDLQSSGSFKGKVINEKSAGIVKEISDKVDDWAKSNPAEFHTPEGLDALKQAIGDIRDTTQFGTNARRSADAVYNAIKTQIQNQAPTYSKVMKDYSQASETLAEIEKGLSLGSKASKDTAVRKLQSLTRNNVQTNYGNRLDLARTLEEKGGVSIGPAVAGQAMNSLLPRGLVGSIEKVGLLGAPFLAPKALALAPFTSPRLMGEAAYGMGRLSGGVGNASAGLLSLPTTQSALLQSYLENPTFRNALIIPASRANP